VLVQIREAHGLPAAPTTLRSGDLPVPSLVSAAWGITEPVSLPPYIQLVGAVFDPTLSPAPPMSADLARWLEESDVPIVYISTGTIARLLPEQLEALVCAEQSIDTLPRVTTDVS